MRVFATSDKYKRDRNTQAAETIHDDIAMDLKKSLQLSLRKLYFSCFLPIVYHLFPSVYVKYVLRVHNATLDLSEANNR